MAVRGPHQHSFTMDTATALHDGAAALTADGIGQVAAASKILDFGNADGDIAYMSGHVVIDVSAGLTDTDENAVFSIQLADDNVAFASATTVRSKPIAWIGDTATAPSTGLAADQQDQGMTAAMPYRLVFWVDNVWGGALYRYMRLYINVGGTTPSVTFKAHFVPTVA